MADQHPIQGLMYTSMQSIKEMIDVNTIVGDPVETPDGTIIIPISRVGLGFAVGGTDHSASKTPADKQTLFGGGAGGGVSITPMAFLVVGKGQIRLMPINNETSIYDRLLDMVPTAIDKLVEIKDSFMATKEAKKAEVPAETGTLDDTFEE